MSKRYVVLRKKTPRPDRGFLEQLELGLVDLNAWGDDDCDLSVYPYPDEVHAFVDDWLSLGQDFAAAMRKMDEVARQHNEQGAGALDEQGISEKRATTETAAAK